MYRVPGERRFVPYTSELRAATELGYVRELRAAKRGPGPPRVVNELGAASWAATMECGLENFTIPYELQLRCVPHWAFVKI